MGLSRKMVAPRDNGKENGNYYITIGLTLGFYWGFLGFRALGF